MSKKTPEEIQGSRGLGTVALVTHTFTPSIFLANLKDPNA